MELLYLLAVLFSLFLSVLLVIFLLTVPKHLEDIAKILRLMYLDKNSNDEDDDID